MEMERRVEIRSESGPTEHRYRTITLHGVTTQKTSLLHTYRRENFKTRKGKDVPGKGKR